MHLPKVSLDEGPLPLWPPIVGSRARGSKSAHHAHHAMHLVLALRGTLRVQGEAGSRWERAAGVLTAPDVSHAIDADGVDVLLVFFDPDSDVGSALLAALPGPVLLVPDAARAALAEVDPTSLPRSEGRAWTERVAATLGATAVPERRPIHPRVKRVLGYLRAGGPEDDTSLEALAAHVGLSPGRLMHAFTESIGVPLRPYLAWLKLQRAAAGIVAGLPLARAAHAAARRRAVGDLPALRVERRLRARPSREHFAVTWTPVLGSSQRRRAPPRSRGALRGGGGDQWIVRGKGLVQSTTVLATIAAARNS